MSAYGSPQDGRNGLRRCRQCDGLRSAPSPTPNVVPSKWFHGSISLSLTPTSRPNWAASGSAVSSARSSGRGPQHGHVPAGQELGGGLRHEPPLFRQVETGEPAVEHAARIAHLAMAQEVDDGGVRHGALSLPAAGECTREPLTERHRPRTHPRRCRRPRQLEPVQQAGAGGACRLLRLADVGVGHRDLRPGGGDQRAGQHAAPDHTVVGVPGRNRRRGDRGRRHRGDRGPTTGPGPRLRRPRRSDPRRPRLARPRRPGPWLVPTGAAQPR